MKRKLIASLMTATMIAGMLTGCGSGSSTDDSAKTDDTKQEETAEAGTDESSSGDEADVNEDGTVNNPEAVKVDENKLVFWSLFSGGDGEYMDKIISDYNATDPDKQVQPIMLVWADYYTKLQTAVAAGKGPDIGISHASKLPELVDQGVVEPLNDYLDELGGGSFFHVCG